MYYFWRLLGCQHYYNLGAAGSFRLGYEEARGDGSGGEGVRIDRRAMVRTEERGHLIRATRPKYVQWTCIHEP